MRSAKSLLGLMFAIARLGCTLCGVATLTVVLYAAIAGPGTLDLGAAFGGDVEGLKAAVRDARETAAHSDDQIRAVNEDLRTARKQISDDYLELLEARHATAAARTRLARLRDGIRSELEVSERLERIETAAASTAAP